MSTQPLSKQPLYRLAVLTAALLTAVLFLVFSLGALASAQAASPTNGSILYAAPVASGIGDCSSWQDACELSMALDEVAFPGDQIWVKQGVHYPGEARTDSFNLAAGVAVYGGFVGTETALAQRDWQANPTVLSGDVDQNDLVDPRGVVITTSNIVGDNAYHVIVAAGVTETAVLDGFFITGGLAQSAELKRPCAEWCGGGLFNDNASPTLRRLHFIGNYAQWDGGGMYVYGGSPGLSDVLFENNVAGYGGGLGAASYTDGNAPSLTAVVFKNNHANWYGGGFYNGAHSHQAVLHDVTFSGNSANRGGGLYNSGRQITMTNILFESNNADLIGGGLYNIGMQIAIANALFKGNNAGDKGGAIRNEGGAARAVFESYYQESYSGGSFPHQSDNYVGVKENISENEFALINVLFSGNSAQYGGGVYNGWYANMSLEDVVFYDNTADYDGGGMYNDWSAPILTHVSFKENQANAGGGMYSIGLNVGQGEPVLTNVIFSGNSAEGVGGGMYNSGVAPAITNTVFSGNSAEYGGGMYNDWYYWRGGAPTEDAPFVKLINVVFSGNRAIEKGGGVYSGYSQVLIRNSIFWHNQDNSGVGTASASLYQFMDEGPVSLGEWHWSTIGYSLVQGCNPDGVWNEACGLDEGGNLADADPLFQMTPDPADAPTMEGNLRLRSGSPAIDAGNNAYIAGTPTDLDGRPRIFNDTVDLGPYEWRPEILHLPVIMKQ